MSKITPCEKEKFMPTEDEGETEYSTPEMFALFDDVRALLLKYEKEGMDREKQLHVLAHFLVNNFMNYGHSLQELCLFMASDWELIAEDGGPKPHPADNPH